MFRCRWLRLLPILVLLTLPALALAVDATTTTTGTGLSEPVKMAGEAAGLFAVILAWVLRKLPGLLVLAVEKAALHRDIQLSAARKDELERDIEIAIRHLAETNVARRLESKGEKFLADALDLVRAKWVAHFDEAYLRQVVNAVTNRVAGVGASGTMPAPPVVK